MARFSAGNRTAAGLTGASGTALPIASLYAGATGGGTLREVGVFNTTTTAVSLALIRLTAAGTASSIAFGKQNPNSGPGLCTFRGTHTVAPTYTDDLGYRVILGAASGAGIIWTFGDAGLVVSLGVANGIGVHVVTGTGQICDVTFVWDE